MPSLPTNLVKIGSVYKFRARVPQDLIDHYAPKKEILLSLRTKSLEVARRLLPKVQQQHFDEWDKIRASKSNAKPIAVPSSRGDTGASTITWDDPGAAWKLDPKTGRKKLVLKDHPVNEELIQFTSSLLIHDSLASDDARRMAKNYSIEEIREYRQRYTEANEGLRDLISTGDTDAVAPSALQLLHLRGINPVGSEEDFQRLFLAYARAALKANEGLLQQMSGEVVARPTVAYPNKQKQTGPSLQSLFEYWRDLVPNRPVKTVHDVGRRIDELAKLIKNKSADTLTRADLIAYRDHLIATGKRPKTVAKDLSFVKAVLQQAFESEKIPLNPAAGIKVPQAKTATAKKRNLDLEDLQVLFGSPIYTQHLRPLGGARDAAAWIPLITLYSGARLEEICQLTVNDVVESGGIRYFSIQPDENAAPGVQTTLKNEESRRNVPIHHRLIEAGLLEYVAAAKAAGNLWLFPALVTDNFGKRGGNFTKWWMRWRQTLGITGSHRCFHAFRHVFKTACRAAGLGEEIHDAITGHAGSGVGRRYGNVPLKTTYEMIQKVCYEGLDFQWVWQPDPTSFRVRKVRRK